MSDLIIPCSHCGIKNRVPGDKLHLKPKCGSCGQVFKPSESGKVLEFDDNIFDKALNSFSLPIMVDFYSPSCGPCRMLAPVIDNLANQYAGKAVIAKYDTSRYQMTAARFQVKGVPTLIFFKQGQVVDQVVGAAPQSDIEQRLNNLI